MPDESETEQLLALTDGHLRLLLAPELRSFTISPDGRCGHHREHGSYRATISGAGGDTTVLRTQPIANAMRPLLHRAPGPLAAIAQAEQVREVIMMVCMYIRRR
jgi:hypothetical protein